MCCLCCFVLDRLVKDDSESGNECLFDAISRPLRVDDGFKGNEAFQGDTENTCIRNITTYCEG